MYIGVKSGKIHRTYVKIGYYPTLDSSVPVLSATMQLSFASGTTTGKTAQVYKAPSSWNPSTLTYANQPTIYADNLLSTCDYNSSVQSLTFNLTDDIVNYHNGIYAGNNYGYVVKYADETNVNPDYNMFCSMEHTTVAKRPVITVNYGYVLPSSLTNGGIYAFQNYETNRFMAVECGEDANEVSIITEAVDETEDSFVFLPQNLFKLEYIPSVSAYYLRAMCSSNGTNRVLDVEKYSGYPDYGSKLRINTPGDPLAQHWLIIGTSQNRFKIVLRNESWLMLTENIDYENVELMFDQDEWYQEWIIYDSTGSQVDPPYITSIADDTYYFNNLYYGKYLHNSNGTPNAASGFISSLGDTIRWKVTHVGNNNFTIQPTNDLTKYLYTIGTVYVGLSSPTELSDEYLWKLSISGGTGGMLIRNVATAKYLRQSETNSLAQISSIGTPGTKTYNECVWRMASQSYYGDTASCSKRELSELSTINNIEGGVNEYELVHINSSLDEIWADTSDFTYTFDNSDVATFENGMIKLLKVGGTKVVATHKVTNSVKCFYILVGFSSTISSTPLTDSIVAGLNQPYDIWPASEESRYYLYEPLDRAEALIRISDMALMTIVGGEFLNYPDAADMLEHYLDNEGTLYVLNFKKTISEWQMAQNYREEDINCVMQAVEASATTDSKTFRTLRAFEHKFNDASNWGYAVGSYSTSITCTYTKTASNTYVAQITYELHDAYDWDKDIHEMGNKPVSPSELWELHHGGVAKNYEVYGSNTFTLTWTDGETFSEGAVLSNEA